MEHSIRAIARLHPNIKIENGVYSLINKDEPLLEEKIRGILQMSGPLTTEILANSLGIPKTYLMFTLNQMLGYGVINRERVWSVNLYWLAGDPLPTPELRKRYYLKQLMRSKICNRKNETSNKELSKADD